MDTASTLNILSTMLTVATTEVSRLSRPPTVVMLPFDTQAQTAVTSGEPRPHDLVNLLCALQTRMLFWCRQHLCGEKKDTATALLTDCRSHHCARLSRVLIVSPSCSVDTSNLVSCCGRVLERLEEMETILVCSLSSLCDCMSTFPPSQDTTLTALENTVVSRTLPEMVTVCGWSFLHSQPVSLAGGVPRNRGRCHHRSREVDQHTLSAGLCPQYYQLPAHFSLCQGLSTKIM